MRLRALLMALLLSLSLSLAARDGASLISGQFKLNDAKSGKSVTQASYAGKFRLVFFGFTRCPIVCPQGLNTLDGILRELGAEAAGYQALFITIDPERDKLKVIRDYLKGHDPRVVGLGGSRKAVAKAMMAFRLEAEKMGQGQNYLLEHPGIIFVMGKEGEYLGVLPSQGDIKDIAKSLRDLLAKT